MWFTFANILQALAPYGENVDGAAKNSHFLDRSYKVEKEGSFVRYIVREKARNGTTRVFPRSARSAARVFLLNHIAGKPLVFARSHAWLSGEGVSWLARIIRNGTGAKHRRSDLMVNVNASNQGNELLANARYADQQTNWRDTILRLLRSLSFADNVTANSILN